MGETALADRRPPSQPDSRVRLTAFLARVFDISAAPTDVQPGADGRVWRRRPGPAVTAAILAAVLLRRRNRRHSRHRPAGRGRTPRPSAQLTAPEGRRCSTGSPTDRAERSASGPVRHPPPPGSRVRGRSRPPACRLRRSSVRIRPPARSCASVGIRFRGGPSPDTLCAYPGRRPAFAVRTRLPGRATCACERLWLPWRRAHSAAHWGEPP